MLIHLLSEGFHKYVSNGVGSHIGLQHDAAISFETFDLRDRFGAALSLSRGVRSGDTVTFWAVSQHFWRVTSSDRIAHDRSWPPGPSSWFQIWTSDGRRFNRIRHGDSVVLSDFSQPRHRWVEIDSGGAELKIGARSATVPASAARFTFFEANGIAALSADRADHARDGAVVVPVPAGRTTGFVEFDYALSHEGLPPRGTRLTFHLDGGPGDQVVPSGLWGTGDEQEAFLVPVGQRTGTARVFIPAPTRAGSFPLADWRRAPIRLRPRSCGSARRRQAHFRDRTTTPIRAPRERSTSSLSRNAATSNSWSMGDRCSTIWRTSLNTMAAFISPARMSATIRTSRRDLRSE